ncbi:hypothetical protein AB1Y20_007659 [Prymnesium parvum]|uniref:NADH:ubiquinone oxidoreductase intermediate-associated protein 30 domain-containing protein n=1 Tax=Prymnesium parvum TaxID=97485 RepID=A0AB34IXK8_PRYPA
MVWRQLARALALALPARQRYEAGACPHPPLDFSEPTAASSFVAVDDRVMGGASRSFVRPTAGAIRFEGELIVEGGGFASVRYTPAFALPADVEALRMEARSDGRAGYKLTLRSASADPSVSYQFLLPRLEAEDFTEVRMPLAEFLPSIRGRPCPEAPPLTARDVCSLGLMLSRYDAGGGEKVSIPPGRFWLEIKNIGVAESELAINGRRWVRPSRRGGEGQPE